MFQGMPRDEAMIRNFLMGLMVPGQAFNPPVSAEEKAKYEELSAKLLKLSAAASFSFSARERLQNKILKELDELVNVISGDDSESTVGMAVADDTARVLRSLMSNVIQNPFEEKFRKVKLDNKVIASKVSQRCNTQFCLCNNIMYSVVLHRLPSMHRASQYFEALVLPRMVNRFYLLERVKRLSTLLLL